MTGIEVEFDTKECSETVADFTVGFLRLSTVAGKEGADSAGTGVLVSIGKVYGILSAAHVLRGLPESGHVGLVTFTKLARHPQKLKIDMSLMDRIEIAGPEWGTEGPDIGFLRLPETTVGDLKAICTFRNLDIAADRIRENPEPSKYHTDALVGVLDERTQTLPSTAVPKAIQKEFEARFQIGTVTPIADAKELDRCTFVPGPADLLPHPDSYGGTSGGGLWRIFFHFDSKRKQHVDECRLVGIAYFQSGKICDKRVLFCHGPHAIYGVVRVAIKEKWAGATESNDF